jgi:hypothetical protein
MAEVPHVGQVEPWPADGAPTFQAGPGLPPPPTGAGEGMHVVLTRVDGVTDEGLLETPYVFQLPPLEEFRAGEQFNFNDYDTLRVGQHSRPIGRALATVDFQTLFLDWDATYAIAVTNNPAGFAPDPRALAGDLRELLRSGTAFWLWCGHPILYDDPEVAMYATLRTLQFTEKAGEPDARYADVSFTEWRAADIERSQRGKQLPTTHVVGRPPPGNPQTLRSLAVYYYNGRSSLWKLIKKANGLSNYGPETALKKGRVLTIPAITDGDDSPANKDDGGLFAKHGSGKNAAKKGLR